MTTIAQALQQAIALLPDQPQARLDAEVLLAHALQRPRSYLHAWPDAELDHAQASRFHDLLRQRVAGRPVAYLTGHREFWSLDLEVTPDTLIPRPETELLVEQALALLPAQAPLDVADFGTGSGAIALALAHERRHWRICAVDRSPACLAVAQRNARRLGIDSLMFVNADWSAAFSAQSLDAMISNPPYVAEQDSHLQQGDIRFEPRTALASGARGLDDLERLIGDASRVLKSGGLILLEHAPEHTEFLHKMLNQQTFTDIMTVRDMAGLERVTRARRSA